MGSGNAEHQSYGLKLAKAITKKVLAQTANKLDRNQSPDKEGARESKVMKRVRANADSISRIGGYGDEGDNHMNYTMPQNAHGSSSLRYLRNNNFANSPEKVRDQTIKVNGLVQRMAEDNERRKEYAE